jgi:hypothetical protein
MVNPERVILNEVKNLIKSICFETLRFAQGDKKGLFQGSQIMGSERLFIKIIESSIELLVRKI